MASNVITVKFLCPDDPSQPGGVKRKLLKDMDVQKVTGLAQKLFKSYGKIPSLSFVQHDVSKRILILVGIKFKSIKKSIAFTINFIFVNSLQLSKEEIPLDKPLQKLNYYSIQDGDHILVRW